MIDNAAKPSPCACGNRSRSGPAIAVSGGRVDGSDRAREGKDPMLAGTGGARRVLYWKAGVGRLSLRTSVAKRDQIDVSDRGTLGGLTQFVAQLVFSGSTTSQ